MGARDHAIGHPALTDRPTGLAMYQPHMKDASELLQAADSALRAAEEAGGGRGVRLTEARPC